MDGERSVGHTMKWLISTYDWMATLSNLLEDQQYLRDLLFVSIQNYSLHIIILKKIQNKTTNNKQQTTNNKQQTTNNEH